MKHFIFLLLGLLVWLVLSASCSMKKPPAGSTLNLQFKLSHTGGNLMVAVFDNPEDFKRKRPVFTRKIPAEKLLLEWKIKTRQGKYAVMCFQDLNNNEYLDMEGYLPSEPWGMSRNPILTGPPSWELLVIDAGKDAQTINVK